MCKCLLLFAVLFSTVSLNAQVFLQIEPFNTPHTIKFQVGDQLMLKTYEDDEYTLMEIEEIMIDEDVIIFDRTFLALESIKEVKLDRKGIEPLSNLLMGFGISYLSFAGILELADRWDFSADTAVIGGGAVASGFLIKRTMGKKRFRMGKNARLRIIDLRIR